MAGSFKRKINKALTYGGNWFKHKFDVVILYFDWLFSSKSRIKKELIKHGLGDCTVKPYRARKWHNGTSVFYAESNDGRKYFVKRSLNKKAIQAEVNLVQNLSDISEYASVNVCKLFFVTNDKKFLVEEFIDAKPLSNKDFISQIPKEDKLKILNNLSDLVGELHRRGIVHSDLTPKNILITKEAAVYIIDFEYSVIRKSKDSAEPVNIITKNKKKLRNLGAKFSMRNGIIDDGYSLMAVSKYLIPDLLSYNYTLWRRINLLIGQLQYDTDKGVFIDQ